MAVKVTKYLNDAGTQFDTEEQADQSNAELELEKLLGESSVGNLIMARHAGILAATIVSNKDRIMEILKKLDVKPSDESMLSTFKAVHTSSSGTERVVSDNIEAKTYDEAWIEFGLRFPEVLPRHITIVKL